MLADKVHELLETTRDLALERVYRVITPRRPLPPEVASWRVAFCGASVGYNWRLPLVYPGITTFTEYAFDKGPLVERALGGSPEAVVLKQCAAYFPEHGGETDRVAFCEWIERIGAAGSRPIIATVVPVTATHAAAHPGRAEGLWAFNDWLRELASERNLTLLDLERTLRISRNDRHLRAGLDDGDGLHLRYGTYRAYLDHLLPIALLDAYLR
jgi:hypothetical protein